MAPAFASTVSAELVRILRACGVRVLATFIDDILIASYSEEKAHRDVALAKTILRILNLPANAEQKGPSPPHVGVPFVVIHVRPADSSLSITNEYRQYIIQRLTQILACRRVPYKVLESLVGSLTWLCEVMLRSRPRRAHIYAALTRADPCGPVRTRPALSLYAVTSPTNFIGGSMS